MAPPRDEITEGATPGMPAPNGITQKVRHSLENTPYACSSLDKLAGGVANFVYRGTLIHPLPDGSKSIVIKHTEPFSASNSGFKITDTRANYEQTILSALNTLKPIEHSGIAVQTPYQHHFFPETHTQVSTDLPASVDLKTYVLTHAHELSEPRCKRLGLALGIWLRRLHTWALEPAQQALVKTMTGNREMKDLKYRLNYVTLVQTVANFPHVLDESKPLFERVRDDARAEMESGEGQLIHGDFWTGNVIFPSTHPDDETVFPVYVLDWELCQVSSPAYDLGQMLAELYCLFHFKHIGGALWLMDALTAGYGPVDTKLALKAAVHTGVHLVCWGSRVPGWGTKDQVEDVVRLGRDWVVRGWEGDVGFFLEGPLGGLFA